MSLPSETVHDYLKSFGLTFSNELGDRSFILCALLSSQAERNILLVIIATISGVLLVNFAAIGLVTFAEWMGVKEIKNYSPYLNILVGIGSLTYGVTHIGLYIRRTLIAYREATSHIEDTIRAHGVPALTVNLLEEPPPSPYEMELSDDVSSVASTSSSSSSHSPENSCYDLFTTPRTATTTSNTARTNSATTLQHSDGGNQNYKSLVVPSSQSPHCSSKTSINNNSRRTPVMSTDPEELEQIVSGFRGDSTCDVMKKLLPMMVLSEVGDKSMVTSLVLASTCSFSAVCLGVISGIIVCMLLAALVGHISSIYNDYIDYDLISAIVMTLVGIYTLIHSFHAD